MRFQMIVGSVALFLIVGCSGLFSKRDPKDIPADERGQLINQNMVDGRAKIAAMQEDYSIDVTDPEDVDQVIPVFQDALEYFLEAKRLDGATPTPSATPRLMVANTLHSIAVLYGVKHRSFLDKIAAAESAGQTSAASLQRNAAKTRELMAEYASRSNRELDFYIRHLYRSAPQIEVFEVVARNHEMRGEWGKAAVAMRRYSQGFKEPFNAPYLKLANAFEERAFEELDNGQ